ncbi:MAG: four helix bundle protein [Ardenticatenaceae bacterium]|nr:four helix bundle protein [Ardenticatenaceae bacterium]
MSKLPYVKTFRDLVVYQQARQLAQDVFALTKQFPKEENFALTDQIRRSSRSIGAQIAEAWAKRRYEKHFLSKLTDADGEQQETQHWLETALDCTYITREISDKLLADCQSIGRLLGSMMAKSAMFCNTPPNQLREHQPTYFIEPTDH